MKNPLKETYEVLVDSPQLIKISGISEERQLTVEMIEKIIEEINNNNWNVNSLATCQQIIKMIRNEVHRKDFD